VARTGALANSQKGSAMKIREILELDNSLVIPHRQAMVLIRLQMVSAMNA
jgi:hypothetical protein